MFKHDNIVKQLGTGNNGQNTWIALEFMEHGDLADFMFSIRDDGLEESQCVHFMQQICNGLKYIHDNKIVHLDINPTNILLDSNYTLKISDFGHSKTTT